MRKKSIFAMIIVFALMMSLSGCGKQGIKAVMAHAIENIEMSENTGDVTTKVTSSSVEETKEVTTTEQPEEITYIETESLYIIEESYNDGKMYDTSSLERVSKNYDLTKNVDVYWLDMDLAGYTKDGVSVDVISKNDEWCYCIFDAVGYLIKTDELMEAIAKPVVAEATPSDPVAESPKPESVPVVNEPVMDIPVAEVPVVEESDKYTPEEAIAVYRSIIEANGIIWDPSSKGNWDDTIGQYPIEEWYLHDRDYNGTNWGTGFIYLDKGYPEQAAQMELEGMAYGDGVGHSHTHYYCEVTGYDENCVYVVAWGY